MARIFISYSHKDEEFARRIARSLSDLGVDIWIDVEHIPAGMKWSSAIQQGLQVCELMLVVISPDSMASTNVEDEWQYYLDKRKPIIPVLWQPAELHFQLNRIQYIDFCNQTYHTAFERLIRELQAKGVTFNTASTSSVQQPPPSPVETIPASSAAPTAPTTADLAAAIRAIIGDPFDLCDVPAGEFLYGKENQKMTLPAFAIAKYPITYSQFQIFIDAKDGFKDKRWWDGLAADAEHRQQSGNQAWKIADHPRENVSWYDAIAFCRWISFKLGGSYAIDKFAEWVLRLPTEFEWEKAARGTDGRLYPYGKQYDKTKGNTEESSINQTTPVMQYPRGASPYGVLDMSGNLWEWCMTNFKDPASNTINENMGSDAARVLRGGSWDDGQYDIRVVDRLRDGPSSRDNLGGFRVVCGVPIL